MGANGSCCDQMINFSAIFQRISYYPAEMLSFDVNDTPSFFGSLEWAFCSILCGVQELDLRQMSLPLLLQPVASGFYRSINKLSNLTLIWFHFQMTPHIIEMSVSLCSPPFPFVISIALLFFFACFVPLDDKNSSSRDSPPRTKSKSRERKCWVFV